MTIPEDRRSLLMVPGPTPVVPAILDALGEPTISHTSAELADIIRRCQDGIRRASGVHEHLVYLFAGSGTLAQEAAVVNLVGSNDHLLVVSNGYFGDRFTAIGQAHGLTVTTVVAPWGSSVGPEELEQAISGTGATVVAMTHVDTSTGVAAPLRSLVSVAKAHGALVIVDSVCGLGGMSVEGDQLGIDVVLSGAQKALGVPPGLAILAVSPAALQHRRAIPRVPTFYADFLNWEVSMRDPRQYFSTHAVNMFFALDAALRIVLEEGLQARFERHRTTAEAFRAAAGVLGFGSLTALTSLAPTLSVLEYGAGVEDEPFREALQARGVVAAGCLGPWKGRGVRFGHMGNITRDEVLRAIGAIEEALAACGAVVDDGGGVAAARSVFDSSAAAVVK